MNADFNVLFIASGNRLKKISPIVTNQGESLKKSGVSIDYYMIKGKGVWGYLKNITRLKKKINQGNYQIIHAHYSASGILAFLTGKKPLIVSLMGSEVKPGESYKILKWFIKYCWTKTIVKSKKMEARLGLNNIITIPNGVNLDIFKPLSSTECKEYLSWNTSYRHILFASSPKRPEKNFQLASDALKLINHQNLEIHYLEHIPSDKVPVYFNAADVILLTSLREGSPNVIKEAMACNKPIVSTNVGDVEWLMGNTEGCYLSEFKPEILARQLKKAISFSEAKDSTKGRNRIIELELDDMSVAEKITEVYREVLKQKRK